MSVARRRLQAHSRRLERGDARIAYDDVGQGPAVVFVHGWALNRTMWRAQVAQLSADYRVICVDRRGCGESSGEPDARADPGDLLALANELGLERLAIVGMSQGARAALALAPLAGGRIACVVLDGPPAIAGALSGHWREDVDLPQLKALLQSGGSSALRAALKAHPLLRLVNDAPETQRLLTQMLASYRDCNLALTTATNDTPPQVRADTLTQPVLVINGEFDSAHRHKIGNAFATTLLNASYRQIAGAGHLCALDKPVDYNRALSEFFNNHLS